MTATKRKVRAPREARTFNQICDLPRDNWSTRNFWMMLATGHVTIGKQTAGQPSAWMVEIPRAVFEAFIRAYETGSTRKRKPRA